MNAEQQQGHSLRLTDPKQGAVVAEGWAHLENSVCADETQNTRDCQRCNAYPSSFMPWCKEAAVSKDGLRKRLRRQTIVKDTVEKTQ